MNDAAAAQWTLRASLPSGGREAASGLAYAKTNPDVAEALKRSNQPDAVVAPAAKE